jgi:hypothetical protein
MARTGRKTTITKDLVELIINAFLMGNYATVVSDYAGITPQTLYNWLNKGEELSREEDKELDEIEQLFVDLFYGVKKARALSEMKSVEVIRSASQTSWQAAAWYLERTANDRWGRVVRTEVTGADGGAIEISAEALNNKLEALLDKHILDAVAVETALPVGEAEQDIEIDPSDVAEQDEIVE